MTEKMKSLISNIDNSQSLLELKAAIGALQQYIHEYVNRDDCKGLDEEIREYYDSYTTSKYRPRYPKFGGEYVPLNDALSWDQHKILFQNNEGLLILSRPEYQQRQSSEYKAEMAKKAAKCWADFLRNGSKLDHGDRSSTGAFVAAMSQDLQNKSLSEITPMQISTFEEKLAELFLAKMESRGGTYCLGEVDYNPDRSLSEAANHAQIEVTMGTFPYKTFVQYEAIVGKLWLKYGYRSEPTDITEYK